MLLTTILQGKAPIPTFSELLATYGPYGVIVVVAAFLTLLWYFGVIGNRKIESNSKTTSSIAPVVDSGITIIDLEQSKGIAVVESLQKTAEKERNSIKQEMLSKFKELTDRMLDLERNQATNMAEYVIFKEDVTVLKSMFSHILNKLDGNGPKENQQ